MRSSAVPPYDRADLSVTRTRTNGRSRSAAGVLARDDPRRATSSLADQAYDELRNQIVRARFAKGTVLREAEIARQLGMSRTPVREALGRLQAEDLVAPTRRGGYVVVELTEDELRDIYAVRATLERLAARLGALGRTNADLGQLSDLLDQMDSALGSAQDERLAELNGRFHRAIAAASHNHFLERLLSNIHEIFARYRAAALGSPGRRRTAHAQHRALVQALAKRDESTAGLLAERHVADALRVSLGLTERPGDTHRRVRARVPPTNTHRRVTARKRARA
jgi:DNA-binding GntR family transcriptional regulator